MYVCVHTHAWVVEAVDAQYMSIFSITILAFVIILLAKCETMASFWKRKDNKAENFGSHQRWYWPQVTVKVRLTP
jgi:hypothetical protein